MIYRYLQYVWRGQTKYYIHSPFVYQLAEEVIYDQRYYYAFEDIALLRHQLLKSQQHIQVTDYGAGSHGQKRKQRKLKDIVRRVTATPKVGELLFGLVQYFEPQYILELGTSVGLGTLYQAMPIRSTQVWTLEGCPQTAQIAQKCWKTLEVTNITPLVGAFNQTLPIALQQIPALDFVFFDGNHQKEPTLQYFEQCLPLAHDNSVWIFDDIHWSAGMEAAWHTIQQHPKVTVTIDLFRLGIVFFRPQQAKEHFTLYW